MKNLFIFLVITIFCFNVSSYAEDISRPLEDRYNLQKDYFDYSVVLTEFPKEYL